MQGRVLSELADARPLLLLRYDGVQGTQTVFSFRVRCTHSAETVFDIYTILWSKASGSSIRALTGKRRPCKPTLLIPRQVTGSPVHVVITS